ncbi:MAG TPA: methyltransferase domain-containing protein, partial [Candidatus Hydrogenedentes bacterium]|nr:methyltransferase domain-containing protein [Candidatus Hydrogenedentota bacterium]
MKQHGCRVVLGRWIVCGTVVLCGVAASDLAEDAGGVLDVAGRGGLVVHLGCGDALLTEQLRGGDGCLVHGLDADPVKIDAARARMLAARVYGAVSVEQWTHEYLPYADNIVNLLVVSDWSGVSMEEALRVLAPGGVVCRREDAVWEKRVKPRPEALDEWTHYLHDASGNAVAMDSAVRPPNRMQWVAGPRFGRSHEIDTTIGALVSAGGRLFYIVDEGLTGITDERLPSQWALAARDAFSGVLLWKRPLPNWGWREWKREELEGKDWTGIRGQRTQTPPDLPRRLVALGTGVYVTLGWQAPVSVLDAATGDVVRTCEGTEHTQEIVCANGV